MITRDELLDRQATRILRSLGLPTLAEHEEALRLEEVEYGELVRLREQVVLHAALAWRAGRDAESATPVERRLIEAIDRYDDRSPTYKAWSDHVQQHACDSSCETERALWDAIPDADMPVVIA